MKNLLIFALVALCLTSVVADDSTPHIAEPLKTFSDTEKLNMTWRLSPTEPDHIQVLVQLITDPESKSGTITKVTEIMLVTDNGFRHYKKTVDKYGHVINESALFDTGSHFLRVYMPKDIHEKDEAATFIGEFHVQYGDSKKDVEGNIEHNTTITHGNGDWFDKTALELAFERLQDIAQIFEDHFNEGITRSERDHQLRRKEAKIRGLYNTTAQSLKK